MEIPIQICSHIYFFVNSYTVFLTAHNLRHPHLLMMKSYPITIPTWGGSQSHVGYTEPLTCKGTPDLMAFTGYQMEWTNKFLLAVNTDIFVSHTWSYIDYYSVLSHTSGSWTCDPTISPQWESGFISAAEQDDPSPGNQIGHELMIQKGNWDEVAAGQLHKPRRFDNQTLA